MSKELKSLKFKNLGSAKELKSLKFKNLGAEEELKSLKFKNLGTAKELKSLKFKKNLGGNDKLGKVSLVNNQSSRFFSDGIFSLTKFKNVGKNSPINVQSSRLFSDNAFTLTKLGSTATASLPTEIKIALTLLIVVFLIFRLKKMMKK